LQIISSVLQEIVNNFVNDRSSAEVMAVGCVPVSYHIIISYQKFMARPLLRDPRPQVHYKSQPIAKTQRKTLKKSTTVKSLTKIV